MFFLAGVIGLAGWEDESMRVEPKDIKVKCRICGAEPFIQIVLPMKGLSPVAPNPTLRLACPNRDDEKHLGEPDFEIESN